MARKRPGESEVIVTDPHADARLWSEALNMGAYDLVSQPFYEPEVRRILYYACARASAETHRVAAVLAVFAQTLLAPAGIPVARGH